MIRDNTTQTNYWKTPQVTNASTVNIHETAVIKRENNCRISIPGFLVTSVASGRPVICRLRFLKAKQFTTISVAPKPVSTYFKSHLTFRRT